ncbi:DsbA family protein [Frigidibacter sp. MR17.24]|uniref:DsbA family protein n=1 Tax=Frigidibacter sp. MR17.24 TaxID=3127345 RepID=UPI003012DADC
MDRRQVLGLGIGAGLALAAARPAAAEPTPAAVLRDPDAPVLGNPEGDVTIVEFFDYQCGFCRRMHPVLRAALARDPGLRLVMKDVPIFGPGSVHAARMALAASVGPGTRTGATTGGGTGGGTDYARAVDALMAGRGALSPARVDRLLARAGLDVAGLRAGQGDARWSRLIRRNMEQAEDLGFTGTPAFVIGRVLYPGAMDGAMLDRLVAEARG